MKTLQEYLDKNFAHGVIDHAIRADVNSEIGQTSFYIHPSGVNGETLDFVVGGNCVSIKPDYRDEWSRVLPDEGGVWWWWNEDEDSNPIPVHIEWSGTDGKCFATQGQYGWNRFQNVEEMGGYWKRCNTPGAPIK